MTTSFTPWAASLSQPEYLLTLYFVVVATLALLAGFLRALLTQREVGAHFRPAIVARIGVTGVATASYAIVLTSILNGYDRVGGMYVPNDTAILAFAARYMDWSVTVPLLTIELMAVVSFAGAVARRGRMLAASTAFLMIFTGFIGAIASGGDTASLLIWGAISCVFWIITDVVLVRAVRVSLPQLTPASALLLKKATILLLSGWFVYPVVYLVQVFGDGGGWATTMQVALCATDVIVKIGFGTLIHRVAKLRTAEDVRAGTDVHPESIWISSVKQSDAGLAPEVYLAAGAVIHERRSKPPMGTAVPGEPPTEFTGYTPPVV
jgi:bacteriorhodopsin